MTYPVDRQRKQRLFTAEFAMPERIVPVLDWQRRQIDRFVATRRAIQLRELTQQDDLRPRIRYHVRHREMQDGLVLRAVQQRDAQHWPMLEIERLAAQFKQARIEFMLTGNTFLSPAIEPI